MRSTFAPETRGRVLQGLFAGLTLAEAIERAGLAEATVKAWLTRGRKDLERHAESEHAMFARAVDEAREVAATAELSLPEFKGFLAKAVRGGSVAAMRLWLDLQDREQREPDGPFTALDAAANGSAVFDELARRARERPNRHRRDAGYDHDHDDDDEVEA